MSSVLGLGFFFFFLITIALTKLFGNFLASKVFWHVWIRLSFAFSSAGALMEAELPHPAGSLHNVFYVLHCVMEEKSCHYSLQILNPSSTQRGTIWKANSSFSSIISGCFSNILYNLGLKAPVFSGRSMRHWGMTGWSPGTGMPSCWVISLAIINSHCLSAIWLYTLHFLWLWWDWKAAFEPVAAGMSVPANRQRVTSLLPNLLTPIRGEKGLDTNQ